MTITHHIYRCYSTDAKKPVSVSATSEREAVNLAAALLKCEQDDVICRYVITRTETTK